MSLCLCGEWFFRGLNSFGGAHNLVRATPAVSYSHAKTRPAMISSATSRPVHAPRAKPHRFFLLLVAELVLILGFPFTAGSDLRDHFFAPAIVVFTAALYAVLGRGKVTIIAFVLGVPAIAIYLVNMIGLSTRMQVTAQVLGVLFLAFVTGAFIYKLISDPASPPIRWPARFRPTCWWA